jgi:hypothetical protein
MPRLYCYLVAGALALVGSAARDQRGGGFLPGSPTKNSGCP